jgi:hypothetical protein
MDANPTNSQANRRGLIVLVAVWLVLSIGAIALARQNLSAPGLYYDEAVFAGLAKDFVLGEKRLHMPGCERPILFGRPFPVFVQPYLGALKSWMLIPSFALFGSNVAVLRLTNLFWALLALLVFMLVVRRSLGLRAALIAGLLLIADPNYFFLGALDWGAAIGALLCRCLAFWLGLLWWRRRNVAYLFLAGLFLGLGVFNKVDFLVFIAGSSIAAVCFYHRPIWTTLRARPSLAIFSCLGLLLGAGAMIFKIGRIVTLTVKGQALTGPREVSEKLHTLGAMYDGSYFYRLMNIGGVFEKMYDQPAGVHALLWLILILAIIAAGIFARARDRLRLIGFLFVSLILITIGVLVLPGAVRIHHAILAFPFPQLIIAVACTFFWERPTITGIRYTTRAAIAAAILILVGSDLLAISKTEKLAAETGGRGRWSDSLDRFCQEYKSRSDLVIASLDWGFNEQVAFLTDAPKLVEPFWRFPEYKELPPLPQQPKYVYLAHSPDYSLFRYDLIYLEALRDGAENVEIKPYSDRQGRVVFYTIRFAGE